MSRLAHLLVFTLLASTLTACAPTIYDRYGEEEVTDNSAVTYALVEAKPAKEISYSGKRATTYKVFGKSYTVLPSADGYVERGQASWYGEDFHGRLTASGQVYNMHDLTAAHRTLPLGTYVEVTRLDNGESVTLHINDRGPFHDDRVIDLSYAAAVALGIDQAGLSEVEVRAIVPDDPDPESTEQDAVGADSLFKIQVGSFTAKESALDLSAQCRALGLDQAVIELDAEGGQIHYKVRINAVSRQRADEVRKILTEAGIDSFIVP